jgi:hypothetical protein
MGEGLGSGIADHHCYVFVVDAVVVDRWLQ